jgi:uncharacterized protein (DUF1499 family)
MPSIVIVSEGEELQYLLISDHRLALKSSIDSANYYYRLRNKLIHERATVTVVDSDIKNYRRPIEQLLHALFDLNFLSPIHIDRSPIRENERRG